MEPTAALPRRRLGSSILVAVLWGSLLARPGKGAATLRWMEDFAPCTGTTSTCLNGINLNTWSFDLGDGSVSSIAGWGNDELQCYTNSTANARVAAKSGSTTDGILTITALRAPDSACENPGKSGSTRGFTSARLISRNKRAFKYKSSPPNSQVKIEALMLIPKALGSWPAFWMLPDTTSTSSVGASAYGGGWCTGGEIDIMEHINSDATVVGSLHWGGSAVDYENCKFQSASSSAASTPEFSTVWTKVGVVWGRNAITWYVNDVQFHTMAKASWWTAGVSKSVNQYAPFDQPFYILLNMAVGGNWPGFATGTWSSIDFKVDWIKVWDM